MIVLKNCYFQNEDKGDILLNGEKIQLVQNNIEPQYGWEVIDLQNALVTPGFVDCHMHLDKALVGSDKSGVSLDAAIEIFKQIKQTSTKDKIKENARLALDKAIANGTILIRTHADIDPFIGLISCEALLELKEEYRGIIEIQVVAFPQEGINKVKGVYEMMEEACKMGVDSIGGIPAKDIDPEIHVEKIFNLAEKYNILPDLHVDESDDPKDLTILHVAQETINRDFIGKVNVAHCCSLAALEPEMLHKVMSKIIEAKLNFIALPTSNLYLQGREDSFKIRRGVAPIKVLLKNGLKIALASDNIQDAFVPLGNANLLQVALITAYACYMGIKDDLEQLFDMITEIPSALCNKENIMMPDKEANLAIINSKSRHSAIIEQAQVLGRVFKGKVELKNTVCS